MRIYKHKASIGPLQGEHKLLTEDLDKAEILNNFFSSVYTIEDNSSLPDTEGLGSNYKMPNITITEERVKEKLDFLNVNKSFGPDEIPSKVLKECSNELCKPLCTLFKESVKCGILPSDWKSATVTALFKKGDKRLPGNYRPVSLTCVICKVLESIITDEIVNFLDTHNLYSNCQFGFRKGRSCVSQLLEALNKFTKYLDDSLPFDIIYLDFKKAFDSVPHNRLLLKLESYGISDDLISWIRDFLKNRIQKVRVGSSLSSEGRVLSGIPQGSILGPVLFNIFINDLPLGLTSDVKIFADDTKLFNLSSNSSILQDDLNKLLSWSKKWQLTFNISKCKVLYCGKNNPKKEYFLNDNNMPEKIDECLEEKDLGVIFDQQLLFDKHIQTSITKANQILGIIKRSFEFMDKNVIILLYKSMVRPHLEYANAVWAPALKRQSVALERVQRRATKLIPQIKYMTYSQRLKTLKLPSLKFRRLRGDLIQVFKILNGIDNVEIENIFTLAPYSNTRNSLFKIFINHARTNKRKFYINNRIAKTWNTLTNLTKTAKSTNTFKNFLENESQIELLKFQFDQ